MVYTTYITLIAGAYHCYILRVLRIKHDISIKIQTAQESLHSLSRHSVSATI